MEFVESNLTFDFDSSLSIQYDNSKYYKEKFQFISDRDISAVDFITIDEKILSTISASLPWSVKETQK